MTATLTRHRATALLVAIPIAVVLSLTGCSANSDDSDAAGTADVSEKATPTPTPTPTFASVSDLAGTAWYGTDSEDEDEKINFQSDGTVLVTADGHSYPSAAVITGDSIAFDIHWDAPYGIYHYTAKVDPTTQTLQGSWVPERAERQPGTLSFDYIGPAED